MPLTLKELGEFIRDKTYSKFGYPGYEPANYTIQKFDTHLKEFISTHAGEIDDEVEIDKAKLPILHIATYFRDTEVISSLAPYVNVEKRNMYRMTPLDIAARHNDSATAVFLITNLGANVDAQDTELKYTALHYAIAPDRDKDIVKSTPGLVALELIKRGADINVKDNTGLTPLHCAAARGLDSVAQLLIAKRAIIDAIDNRGRTPLDYARSKGKDSVAKLLIENGACSGKTPTSKEPEAIPHSASSTDNLSTLVRVAFDAEPVDAEPAYDMGIFGEADDQVPLIFWAARVLDIDPALASGHASYEDDSDPVAGDKRRRDSEATALTDAPSAAPVPSKRHVLSSNVRGGKSWPR